jgi:NAD(P)H-dependent FMN reductase
VTSPITVPKIAIILGSTRPGRNGEAVAQWVYRQASKRDDARFELVDVLDYNLPLLDEPLPALGQYEREHTKTWAEKVAG